MLLTLCLKLIQQISLKVWFWNLVHCVPLDFLGFDWIMMDSIEFLWIRRNLKKRGKMLYTFIHHNLFLFFFLFHKIEALILIILIACSCMDCLTSVTVTFKINLYFKTYKLRTTIVWCRMIPGYQWLTVDIFLLNDNPSHCHWWTGGGKLIQEEDVASFQCLLLEYYRLSSVCTENARAVTGRRCPHRGMD